MILLVLGVVLGVATLGLVHQMSMFGNTCYYIGELNLQTTSCIPPVVYFGALGVAALLTLVGIVRMLRASSKQPTT